MAVRREREGVVWPGGIVAVLLRFEVSTAGGDEVVQAI